MHDDENINQTLDTVKPCYKDSLYKDCRCIKIDFPHNSFLDGENPILNHVQECSPEKGVPLACYWLRAKLSFQMQLDQRLIEPVDW